MGFVKTLERGDTRGEVRLMINTIHARLSEYRQPLLTAADRIDIDRCL